MSFKRILLVLGGANDDGACAIQAAADLAAHDGAQVEGVFLFGEPAATVPDSFAIGSQGIRAVLEHRDAVVRHLSASSERAFRAAFPGRASGWRAEAIDGAAESLAPRARLADLVVIAAPGSDGAMRRVVEHLAVAAGTPLLVVPEGAPMRMPPKRVIIGWNGAREAKRAVHDALGLLRLARVVWIVEVGNQGQGPSAHDLAEFLEAHCVSAGIRGVARDDAVADKLLSEAAELGADMIVIGAYGRSPSAEALLGGVTQAVLRNTSLPVLVSR